MIWNVYSHDINGKEIKTYNVFKHSSFNEDVEELLKEDLAYDDFDETLNRLVQYYFCSRAECEVVITSLVPHIDNDELDRLNAERDNRKTYRYSINLDVGEKVDYYDQLHLNWEQFVKYVWSFKKKRGKNI
jgi:hypothetical protein